MVGLNLYFIEFVRMIANKHIVVSLTSAGIYAQTLLEAGIPVHVLMISNLFTLLTGFIRLIFIYYRIRPNIVQSWMYHADLLASCLCFLTHHNKLSVH